MDYYLIALVAAGLTAIALIVVIVIFNSKNNKLLLRQDELEYAAVVAGGKLTKLTLDFVDLEDEYKKVKSDLDYCIRKRNTKGQFIPRKKKP
jgi:hypothetical protein